MKVGEGKVPRELTRFRERLKRLRGPRGHYISRRELADRAGVSESAIEKIEVADPPLDVRISTAVRLATALGASFEAMVSGKLHEFQEALDRAQKGRR